MDAIVAPKGMLSVVASQSEAIRNPWLCVEIRIASSLRSSQRQSGSMSFPQRASRRPPPLAFKRMRGGRRRGWTPPSRSQGGPQLSPTAHVQLESRKGRIRHACPSLAGERAEGLSESTFVVDFFAAIVAALALGYVAHRLHLPAIVGYLMAGVVVGPHTPGFRSDVELIRSLAEVGVAFLLFAVGTEVHLGHLRKVQRVGILGGLVQVTLTVGLGALVGRSLGTDWPAAFFFGALIAVSSTTVAVKLLLDRGQLGSSHGRIALAILLMQDLLAVPLILVVTVVGLPSGPSALDLLVALSKTAALLAASLLVGARLIPRLLNWIARTGSQELFLFAAISIALGSAIGTQLLGVSAAVAPSWLESP